MSIERQLRQLHTIKPDQAYARNSRARLLIAAAQPREATWRVVLASALRRPGLATAVASLLLVFALGGSIWKLVIGPVAQLAYLDANALRAEAQAIDTQIHLTDLQYSDPGYQRQRLISPNTDFSSIVIGPAPADADAPPSAVADPAASSTTAGGDDAADSATSTLPAVDGTTNATSTPAEDPTVDAGEAFDILSR